MAVLPANQVAARAKVWIIEDILKGTVPVDVPDFSALHNYVDANEYLQIEGDDDGITILRDGFAEPKSQQRWLDRLNKASDEVDGWIGSDAFFCDVRKAEYGWLDAQLGRAGGTGADWSVPAWKVDPGNARNGYSGERFLIDDNGDYAVVRRFSDEKKGEDRVDTVQSFDDFAKARKWVESILKRGQR